MKGYTRRRWCSAEALDAVMQRSGPAAAEDEAPSVTTCPACGEPVVIVPTASLVGLRRPELFGETVALNAEGPAEFFPHPCNYPLPTGTGGQFLRRRQREGQGLLFEDQAA